MSGTTVRRPSNRQFTILIFHLEQFPEAKGGLKNPSFNMNKIIKVLFIHQHGEYFFLDFTVQMTH